MNKLYIVIAAIIIFIVDAILAFSDAKWGTTAHLIGLDSVGLAVLSLAHIPVP